MSDDTYTLLDAMHEEAELLDEIVKYYSEQELKSKNGLTLRDLCYQDACRIQKSSLNRIINRFENGKEYYLGVVDGKTMIKKRTTTKHLEREYPAVAKAKQNLDVMVGLTKGNTDV